jgi:GT2 family glycosyltransferase
MRTIKKKVVAIVLTINQCDKTLRCISSLSSVENPPFDIVLWDNGSQDETAKIVRKLFPDVLVQCSPVNLGAARGRNEAAKIAINNYQPKYLLFLDNDMTVTPNFLEALIEPFGSDIRLAQTTGKIKIPGAGNRLNDAGGCKINFYTGRTTPIGYGEIDNGQYDKQKTCIPGGFTLVRADVFCEVGGFDTIFDPYGYEDLDFSLRVARAGYYALYMPEAVAFHEVTQTFESGLYTEKYARNKAKNWLLFLGRHATPFQRLVFFILGLPFIILRLFIRELKKGNFNVLRGIVQGAFDSYRFTSRSR